MKKQKTSQQHNTLTHLDTHHADHTTPLFFSWDYMMRQIFFVSVYLLLFRLFFTFLFAFVFTQQWHVVKILHVIPVVAFSADIETFTQMNTDAVLATGVAVMGFFVYQCVAPHQRYRKHKVYAWYTGVVMLLVQYATLCIINAYTQFSIRTDLWVIFIILCVLATILLHFWYHHLRLWHIAQTLRKKTHKK